MKRNLFGIGACFSVALSLGATPYTFRPSPSDLYDLAHQNAYTWGISYSNSNLGALENELAHGYRIGSAVLSINGIYDWVAESNDRLFIHLLDNVRNTGVTQITDNPYDNAVNDYFAGSPLPKRWSDQTPVYTYTDLDGPKTRDNVSIKFTSAEIDTLTQYLGSGPVNLGTIQHPVWSAADFGFGFDPDCHFYNCGISFCVETKQVPDGAETALLMGLALAAIAGLRRALGA